VCAKTGVLCSSCEALLKKGQVSKLEIKISNELLELEKKYSELKNVSFYRAIEREDFIILIVGKGEISNFLGPYGKTRKAIQEKLNKNVRIIEKTNDPKKILEDLIAPVPVLGINQIFLPTGEVENKARIAIKDSSKITIDIKILEEIIYSLTDREIRIAFE